MLTGTVRFYNLEMGYGFIEPHEGHDYAHIFLSAPESRHEICVGMRVMYTLSQHQGELVAVDILPLRSLLQRQPDRLGEVMSS